MAHRVPTISELESWIIDLQDNATCVEVVHTDTDKEYGILSFKVVIPETEQHDSYIKVMGIRVSHRDVDHLVFHNCPMEDGTFYRDYFRDVLRERFPGVPIKMETMQGGEWLL